ncbi:hypothetical protein FH972_025704 [Carpinus fangiana]|uniref:U4/U6 snRNA-associated-splicing factor PRP24 n=1 Tax=Carpinus fangiana TaxID=176857 RepID=A0A5N6L4D7_9ROSI|nr:hypothetical protein FH972_025704 [Carpinus fangiana]
MDIKSLLSAQDAPESNLNGAASSSSQSQSPTTPASASTSASPTLRPKTRKRQQSLVHQAVTSSTAQHMHDLSNHSAPTSTAPSPHPLSRNSYSASAVDSRTQYVSAPQPPLVQRHSSASMDTLADLATMQHYQNTVRQNSISSRNPDLVSPQRSPSFSVTRMHSDSTTPTGPSALRQNASADSPMPEGPVAVVPQRTFAAPSLSKAELQAVSDLTKQLAENSFNYTSHTQLISLLHQGLISHTFPSPGASEDSTTYPLLEDLRQAREAMDSRFACGEEIWLTWLHDEILLARSTEDRIAVMELCQRAIQEEVGSAPLWRLYGDWMFFLHKTACDLLSDYQSSSLENHQVIGDTLQTQAWSDDDKVVAREVFGWDDMLNVWQQGVVATSWHIPDSNLVWDPYMEILLSELRARPSPEKINHIRQLFWERLRQPHLTWDDTFQTFSQFISTFDNASYEETMVTTKERCQKYLKAMDDRRDTESKLLRAITAADREAEWTIMSEYLEREFAHHRQKNSPHFSLDMLVSLCQRCTLRFPTDADFWEDYMDLLGERPNNNVNILPVAYRATRHVPWAGNLWSKRIYCLEAANKSFEEMEGIKHMATSTGLLEEVGSMDELIKVYSTWCGYLRRRAFSPNAGEDERDIAEVAIRSAIENVKEVGLKRYGKDFKGDPHFRIERIYFKFLAQTGAHEDARRFWAELTITHGDHYEFWERYYLWEMVMWAKEAAKTQTNSLTEPPVHATAVLLKGMRRSHLDWPEKMVEQYQHHCTQHETVEKVQEAQAEARRRMKDITKRRAALAAQAAPVRQVAVDQPVTGVEQVYVENSQVNTGKRKRSDAHAQSAGLSKRVKSTDADESSQQDGPSEPTRDREHTTIVVKHLPQEVEEVKVRQFFRDCGKILSITIVSAGSTSTATIEFETKDDVLAAQTKGAKLFDGQSIEVQLGTGSTLFVANYPAKADEKYIRDLFGPFGEIVSVRFPSLKYAAHRRFCYVQFTSGQEAQAATQLDGNAVGPGLPLTAKISDPSKKQVRSGAKEESREIFVGSLDYATTEADLRGLFDKFGTVEEVRIPRNMDGSGKGFGFVAFATKEEAEAATDMNLKPFKRRALNVNLSNQKGKTAKTHSTTIIRPSATPDPENLPNADGDHASSGKDYRERSIALLNVPDTINDARIRALCEAYGALKKIQLRPDHQGAIVEFEKKADAGKASMALDGHEIIPGRFIQVGEVSQLFRRRSEINSTTAVAAATKPKGAGAMLSSAPVSRPNQGSARRGARGGLGFKRGGPTLPSKDAPTTAKADGASETGEKQADVGGKSQDDFRAMLNKQ